MGGLYCTRCRGTLVVRLVSHMHSAAGGCILKACHVRHEPMSSAQSSACCSWWQQTSLAA
jgi:hypothetical protein